MLLQVSLNVSHIIQDALFRLCQVGQGRKISYESLKGGSHLKLWIQSFSSMKSVVYFTNILQAAFWPVAIRQKTSNTNKYRKALHDIFV